MSDSLDRLTLGQKLTQADLLIRELVDLLEHDLIPKTHVLRRTAQQGLENLESGEITDVTICSTMQSVTDSGTFAAGKAERLISFLDSIENDLQRVSRSV